MGNGSRKIFKADGTEDTEKTEEKILGGKDLAEDSLDICDLFAVKVVREKCAEYHEALWAIAGDEFEIGSWAEIDSDVVSLARLEDEIAGDEVESAVMAIIKNDGSGVIQDEDFFRSKILGELVAEI